MIQLSTSEMVTKYVLGNEYGFQAEADLDYTLIENYPEIVVAVQKGNVDIGFISSEYLESAESVGLTYLFPLTHLMEDYVCCRQTAYSGSIEADREGYVAYLKAQIRAYKDYRSDEDATVKLLAEATGETDEFIRGYLYDTDTNADRTYNPDPNYNGTLAVYDTLLEWDYIDDGTDLSVFYDLSVYVDALNEIISEFPEDTFYQEMWEYFEKNNDQYPNFKTEFGRL